MAHDVFISHSTKDKQTADAVCAVLESRSIRCWVAPRDIQPGADWGESIVEAIRGARVMVLIFSENANQSVQIKREVERAIHHGVIIIPLRIQDILPSGALEYSISTAHWLDAFVPPMERHLTYLADTVQATLDGKPKPNPPPPPPPVTPWWRNNLVLAVGGLVGLFVVYLIVFWMFPPSLNGTWNLKSSSISTQQTSALGDLISAALTGSKVQGQLQVKSLNAYSFTISASDSGTVAEHEEVSAQGTQARALTFTSDSTHKSVAVSYQTLENNGQFASLGIPAGEPILLFGVNVGAGEVILHGNPSGAGAGGASTIDSAVLGEWKGTPFNSNPPNNLWSGTLEINPDGTYLITVTSQEDGVLDARDGNWSARPSGAPSLPSGMVIPGMSTGLFGSGHYSFAGSGTLNIVTDNGSFVFKRN
jgi:hypothetical protein